MCGTAPKRPIGPLGPADESLDGALKAEPHGPLPYEQRLPACYETMSARSCQ